MREIRYELRVEMCEQRTSLLYFLKYSISGGNSILFPLLSSP